jgi:hypothetical protein
MYPSLEAAKWENEYSLDSLPAGLRMSAKYKMTTSARLAPRRSITSSMLLFLFAVAIIFRVWYFFYRFYTAVYLMTNKRNIYCETMRRQSRGLSKRAKLGEINSSSCTEDIGFSSVVIIYSISDGYLKEDHLSSQLAATLAADLHGVPMTGLAGQNGSVTSE